ncbi:transposase [Nitrosomonas communis]|uniref:transposase n=1 Tax=Nitrosomonas communis TaxID=44574 RepID=UPI003D299C18
MPHNLRLLMLPPYSPELNPAENLWDELREKSFHNRVFDSLDAFEITWKQPCATWKKIVNVSNLSSHGLGL